MSGLAQAGHGRPEMCCHCISWYQIQLIHITCYVHYHGVPGDKNVEVDRSEPGFREFSEIYCQALHFP